MIYRSRFLVNASLARVIDFHSRAASMPAITPPPLTVQLFDTPEILSEGDTVNFSLGIGPVSIRWAAHIERVTPNSFIDRQVSGPFDEWVHQHSFNTIDDHTTEVVDEITMRPRSHPLWWLAGMGMWAGLPVLFASRAKMTRRMLL